MGLEDAELRALSADLTKAAESSTPRAKAVVAKTGLGIVRDAKILAPVDTGFLKSTIGMDVDPDGLGLEAGPTASYGGFVERGTSRMAPQPYLGPAFDRHAPGFVAAMEQLGGEVL